MGDEDSSHEEDERVRMPRGLTLQQANDLRDREIEVLRLRMDRVVQLLRVETGLLVLLGVEGVA